MGKLHCYTTNEFGVDDQVALDPIVLWRREPHFHWESILGAIVLEEL